MTLRALLLGFLGVSIISGYTYFNDSVMQQSMFVGNNMPLSVFGCLIFVVLLSPLLVKISKKLALNGTELAIALALTLSVCCVPGSGLMRYFGNILMLPNQHVASNPSWKDEGLVDMIPKNMLADTSGDKGKALNGFIQGLGIGQKHISFSSIPWNSWTKTMSFWLPAILLLWAGLIGLTFVVSRQWSSHEQLPYPVAMFAESIISGVDEARESVFKNRLFWMGAIFVLIVHLNNYAYVWFPKYMVQIGTGVNFGPIVTGKTSLFARGGGAWLLNFTLYFTPMAFAYFLMTNISFSIGIAPLLYTLVLGALKLYGISTKAGTEAVGVGSSLSFGAFLGLFIVLLYTGRHYYSGVFRGAFLLKKGDNIESDSVWGARVFLVCSILFTILISSTGLDWQLAAMFTFMVVLIFVVMSRIIAETGIFFIQANWLPSVILLGIFGPVALGPKMTILLSLLSIMIAIDPREALMPFFVNTFKILDVRKIKLGRFALFSVAAIVISIAIALPVTLYFQYDRGTHKFNSFDTYVPDIPFKTALVVKQQLVAQNTLEVSDTLSGWKRFTHMSPSPLFIIPSLAMIGIVVLFSFLRLRLLKWPLHPVMFLIWNTYPAQKFWASFLFGWFVKVMVTQYGGARIYQKFKPFMIGLIAGEMGAGIIISLIGIVYYLITGTIPKAFSLLPG